MPSVLAIRRPRTVGIVLVVVLVGVAAAWLLPTLGPGDAGVASGPPGGRTDTGAQGAFAIYYVPGGRVAFGTEVRNTSLLPVTIVGLADSAGGFLLDDARLVLGADPAVLGLDAAQVRAFEPVTLEPGATLLIGVVGTFPPCPDARPSWSTGIGISVESLAFDVRVAGLLPAAATVRLHQAVELRGDADAACP